jgi:hypothetical protein
VIDLPDEPRWVEAHGMANDARSWRTELAGGFAIGHDVAKLIVTDASPPAVAAIARDYPRHAILVVSDPLAEALREAGRTPVRALLHTLPDLDALPDLEGAIPLPADADLTRVPEPIAAELADARGRGEIWSCYVDGDPVAFAYAPWRSAGLFDVSVDTLVGARQLGLGTIVASTLIRHECANGERRPVWGADEGNTASLRLARTLGFTLVDRIWVAPP